jgi:hypothetical protein
MKSYEAADAPAIAVVRSVAAPQVRREILGEILCVLIAIVGELGMPDRHRQQSPTLRL